LARACRAILPAALLAVSGLRGAHHYPFADVLTFDVLVRPWVHLLIRPSIQQAGCRKVAGLFGFGSKQWRRLEETAAPDGPERRLTWPMRLLPTHQGSDERGGTLPG